MVRWFAIGGGQYLGFWLPGLAVFALQELPYLLMPLFRLQSDPLMHMTETAPALDVCEKILGSLCVALTVFVVREDAVLFSAGSGREKLFLTLALLILLANWSGWALYFSGRRSVAVMMLFLVALPPLYYAAVGLWRRNVPLTAAASVFLIVHCVHVYGNLKA